MTHVEPYEKFNFKGIVQLQSLKFDCTRDSDKKSLSGPDFSARSVGTVLPIWTCTALLVGQQRARRYLQTARTQGQLMPRAHHAAHYPCR